MKLWLKIKAIAQWLVKLELTEHRHWCHLWSADGGYNNCEHRSGCWMCKGVFCANIERKNCPKCERAGCQNKARYELAASREVPHGE